MKPTHILPLTDLSEKLVMIICKSGLQGWQCHLRDIYNNFAEWEAYSTMYGLYLKLGYQTPEEAWDNNPIIQGSTIPSDYCKAST